MFLTNKNHNSGEDQHQSYFHRLDNASIMIGAESQNESHQYREERNQENYYTVHSRPQYESTESTTLNFLTDDRVEKNETSLDACHSHQLYPQNHADLFENRDHQKQQLHQYSNDTTKSRQHQQDVPFDYSSTNFRNSRTIINAAAQNAANVTKNDNIQIRQIGNKTIISEHRDPYSFYWQLDEVRQRKEDPLHHISPIDYVIDEENILPSPEAHLTVTSPDGEIYSELQYLKPQKLEESKQLPTGWEKYEDPSGFSYYWHVDSGVIQKNEKKPKTPLPRPPTPHRMFENQNVQVQTEPGPSKIFQQLPPPLPIIEEHLFKQTTTKRLIENGHEIILW